jgi:hypothetical protein
MDALVLHLADGRVVEARPKLVLGRDPRCGCPLDDPAVSTLHAVVDRNADGWFIEDLQSLNGTWVRGERIQKRAPIGPGDVVRLGSSQIRVAARDPRQAPVPSAGGAVAHGSGADTVLTFEGAEVLLGVGRRAGAEEVLARFERLAGDLKSKIQHAPTPALRRMYQRQLNDLVRAKDTLLQR